MNTDNTCLVYRDHYFQKAKENMKHVKADVIPIGNKVLKLCFYIIHSQSHDNMLSFQL